MKAKKNLFLMIIVVASMSILNSCESFVDIDSPVDRVITTEVFQNEETANSAILGIYARMNGTSPPFSFGATTIFSGVASDELQYTGTVQAYREFYENRLSATNSVIYNDFWRSAYSTIYHANICLEGLSQTVGLGLDIRNHLSGEAYFIRAFCYFYLVNLFGDVPLILNTDYESNAVAERKAKEEVYEQIISDLTVAKQLLPIDYSGTERTRPNHHAASAILARVYLYLGKYEEAVQTASEIITSDIYTIEQELDAVFLSGSKEAIWQLEPPSGQIFNTLEANRFIPIATGTTRPQYAPTQQLLSAFEMDDKRREHWIAYKTIGEETFPYPFKYKVRSSLENFEYLVMLRLAEQYLIRAEARIQIGDLAGALDDLNIIRSRAGLPHLLATNHASLLDAVFAERRIELFAEWGHRWFDLQRNEQIDAVLGSIKPEWSSMAIRFPIPQQEIIRNVNLTQNPGYN